MISRHSGYSPIPRSKWSYLTWDVPGFPGISRQWLQPLSPRSEWSYLSWDVPGCPGISRHSGYSPRVPGQSGLICPGISRHSGYSPRVPGPRGPICPGMSQDVLGYPDTVATAPGLRSKRSYISVLGCPRMSWDIPTQWLQPLSTRSK